MHFTVFIGALLLTVYVTEGLRPMRIPSGYDSQDFENEEMKACLIQTGCDLGEEMQKAYIDCHKDFDEDDIDFARKALLTIGGNFNSKNRYDLAKEFCAVFSAEQKKKALTIAAEKIPERVFEKCRFPSKHCVNYKTAVSCVAQLVKKNKDEKRCK